MDDPKPNARKAHIARKRLGYPGVLVAFVHSITHSHSRQFFFSVEVPPRTVVSSKEMAANCVRRALRHRVMVSSVRQAVCGLLASGGAVAAQYLGKKMAKAWRSRVP